MDFARQLVTGTVEHVEEIDVLIQRHAEHWRLIEWRLSIEIFFASRSHEFIVRQGNSEDRRHQRGDRNRAPLQRSGISAVHQRHTRQYQKELEA